MIETTKKNKETLKLLFNKINSYRENKISLAAIISDIEGLILSIDNLPEDFKDKFYKYWGVLEEIYAVNLDRKKSLSKKDIKLIDQALDNIINLFQRSMANNGVGRWDVVG